MHGSGAGFAGVAVGAWSDTWVGQVSISEADGKYEIPLSGLPAGTFKVAVVKYETCSDQGGVRTALNCQIQSNVVSMVITENCTGAGASQVTEIDFVGR